jgi:hypothetical protein
VARCTKLFHLQDVPPESMHLIKGIMENFIEMTFSLKSVGSKIRKKRGNKIPVDGINAALRANPVPSEFSRRTRDIDDGNIKCEELRNYAIAFFPLFAEAIGKDKDEYEIFLIFAFLLRAYMIPGDTVPIPGIIEFYRTGTKRMLIYQTMYFQQNSRVKVMRGSIKAGALSLGSIIVATICMRSLTPQCYEQKGCLRHLVPSCQRPHTNSLEKSMFKLHLTKR